MHLKCALTVNVLEKKNTWKWKSYIAKEWGNAMLSKVMYEYVWVVTLQCGPQCTLVCMVLYYYGCIHTYINKIRHKRRNNSNDYLILLCIIIFIAQSCACLKFILIRLNYYYMLDQVIGW